MLQQRIFSTFRRPRITSLANNVISKQSSLSSNSLNLMNQEVIPARRIGLLKWGSLGSIRTSKFASGYTPLQPKPLDSIMEIERAKHKSPEELASIWDDGTYRRNDEGKALPFTRAKSSRMVGKPISYTGTFVLPVFCHSFVERKWLYDNVCSRPYCISGNGRAQPPHMIFTGLEDYKARGTQASPYMTVTFYTEFEQSKDLVFIRGDVVFTSKLTDSEAEWLIETAQSFYLNDVRYKLVERFNKDTREFEFKDVLKALDMPNV
ncbi:hypothetical protein ACFE04_030517 [Oxalis oulophora]